jgi:nucleoside-diphosphate-sugar epimerase
MSKYWGEMALMRRASAGDFVPLIVRVSSPVPARFERLHKTVLKRWIDAARDGRAIRIFGQGSRRQDFVACEDLARGVIQAIESPHAHGTYNLASGTTLSMRELAELIASLSGVQTISEGSDPAEEERWVISINKARADFAYSPRSCGKTAVLKLAESVLC